MRTGFAFLMDEEERGIVDNGCFQSGAAMQGSRAAGRGAQVATGSSLATAISKTGG